MITSSILNSITFKNLDGGNPNKWNTLHENRKQGVFRVIEYCQDYNKDEVIYLQFESDSATVPDINIYIPFLNDTIAGTLVSSYIGDTTRYFYGFTITLSSAYYDKKISFTVVQGSDTLTSEPIYCHDISEQLANGTLKKIRYTNLDRNNGDLSNYWIDWNYVDYMHFYIEAIDKDPMDSESMEILEGSQSKTIISATNYSGISLKTGGIPDYLVLKLKAASSLDYFEVNGIQYIKEGEVEIEPYGSTTFQQASIDLTEKNTIGLNVDDLGITYIDQEVTPVAIIPNRNTAVTTAGWEITNPAGYMLHSIFVKHAATSAGDAIINVGTSPGANDLIDDIQGNVPQSDYTSVWRSYIHHFLNNPDAASTIYVSVSGAGTVLDIIVNFDLIAE